MHEVSGVVRTLQKLSDVAPHLDSEVRKMKHNCYIAANVEPGSTYLKYFKIHICQLTVRTDHCQVSKMQNSLFVSSRLLGQMT